MHNSLSQNDRNVELGGPSVKDGRQASYIMPKPVDGWITEDQVREDPQAKYGIL